MVVVAAEEVGRAGATKALEVDEVDVEEGVIVVVGVKRAEVEEVALDVVVVEGGGRGRGASAVVIEAVSEAEEELDAGGEAVTEGFTITVVVETWAPVL